MGMKSKQAKACGISKAVKDKVWERDGHCCIVCGSPNSAPCAHYIARSQGGLGVEQNIVTLCEKHHRAYDQSPNRQMYRGLIKMYLEKCYPGWDESKLVYHKYD